MIQEGIEAIIIKVAAAGLTTKHLGMTLKEVRMQAVFPGYSNLTSGPRIPDRGKQEIPVEHLWRGRRI